MRQTFTLTEKIKQLLIILLPVLVTQIAMFGMSFADTIMSGRYSAADLAGVAKGASIWVPVQTGLTGILLAITPMVAQHIGAKRRELVAGQVMQGLMFSLVLSAAVIAVGVLAVGPILKGMGLEQQVYEVAERYLTAMAFGIVPLFAYTVLRCFIDALGLTRVTMFITLISLPINVGLNYLLIYGKLGMPELGGPGAGAASALTYWVMLLITVVLVLRMPVFMEFGVLKRFVRISLPAWRELVKIGLPIGLAIFFETSIFAAVTILMSGYNTVTIAAHQSALNFASLLYMIPLSVSMALTILVAFEAGAGRPKDARSYGYLGVGMAILFAVGCAGILFTFPDFIAGMYTKDREVLELTKQFLVYAIFFQLFDAVAAPIQGALRGYKDVGVTFVVALISYWVVGLPVGYLLAHTTSLEAFGYWVGLSTGLGSGAIGLYLRLTFVQKRYARISKTAH